MTRKGVLGLILGAALVIVVIAGYHLGVNRGHALLGFVTLTVVSGMTLALVFEKHGAGVVFAYVLIAGFYAYFAIMYMRTGGTLLGVALGTLYGVIIYLGWLRRSKEPDKPPQT
ncbi:MAG: hypothetical protein ACYTFI_09360 [Planctomycetota bacterium]|jgi:hypothetical protein